MNKLIDIRLLKPDSVYLDLAGIQEMYFYSYVSQEGPVHLNPYKLEDLKKSVCKN